MDILDVIMILCIGWLIGVVFGFVFGRKHVKNELHNYLMIEFQTARRWSKVPVEVVKIIFDYTNK